MGVFVPNSADGVRREREDEEEAEEEKAKTKSGIES